jgi:hypothetical protein
VWRGGRVAPLGANLVVVLYRDKARPGRYLVRFAHNEQVVRPALCGGGGSGSGGSSDCDLGEFLAAAAKRSVDVPGLLAMCDASNGGGSSSSSSSKLGSRVDASSSSSSEDEDGGAGGWETADGLPLA